MLDEAPTSRFHRRAVVISGMGFFTDAYDLFVIATVATLVKTQWHLSTTQTSWVTGSAILAAFFGAVIFGRIADVLGRKTIYVTVAVIMIVGALASALAPGFLFLVIARFVLGLGIGGDYPVSAVLMSEYANRKDRGRLVGLVFSMQALGLIVGPLVALVLLSSGMSDNLTWRILLALGALPAAAVVYLRAKMPESPASSPGSRAEPSRRPPSCRCSPRGPLTPPTVTTRAPGAWACPSSSPTAACSSWSWARPAPGSCSTTPTTATPCRCPASSKNVSPHASIETKLVWTLGLFVVFALPGYLLAVAKMDRIGHRRLQLIGFAVMAACFVALGAVPALTASVGPFLAIFGLSYFFTEFGPNTTTFVLPSEVFPVSMRTTGHGIAAGVGKLGAFIGVFLVPQLQKNIGLRGMLLVAGGAAVLGLLLTRVLPEPAQRTLEDVSGEDDGHVLVLPIDPLSTSSIPDALTA